MAEWLNAPVLKTGMGLRPSRVRIPVSPPFEHWFYEDKPSHSCRVFSPLYLFADNYHRLQTRAGYVFLFVGGGGLLLVYLSIIPS